MKKQIKFPGLVPVKRKIYPIQLILLLFFITGIVYGQTTHPELNKLLIDHHYTPVQMQKLSSGHLCLEVEVNGVTGMFMLDTGAEGSVVEKKRKQKFGLTAEVSVKKAAGIGGTILTVQASPGNKLTIGAYKIEDFTLNVLSLDFINTSLKEHGEEEIDGIIGADILSLTDAIIDYNNLIVYLKLPEE